MSFITPVEARGLARLGYLPDGLYEKMRDSPGQLIFLKIRKQQCQKVHCSDPSAPHYSSIMWSLGILSDDSLVYTDGVMRFPVGRWASFEGEDLLSAVQAMPLSEFVYNNQSFLLSHGNSEHCCTRINQFFIGNDEVIAEIKRQLFIESTNPLMVQKIHNGALLFEKMCTLIHRPELASHAEPLLSEARAKTAESYLNQIASALQSIEAAVAALRKNGLAKFIPPKIMRLISRGGK